MAILINMYANNFFFVDHMLQILKNDYIFKTSCLNNNFRWRALISGINNCNQDKKCTYILLYIFSKFLICDKYIIKYKTVLHSMNHKYYTMYIAYITYYIVFCFPLFVRIG